MSPILSRLRVNATVFLTLLAASLAILPCASTNFSVRASEVKRGDTDSPVKDSSKEAYGKDAKKQVPSNVVLADGRAIATPDLMQSSAELGLPWGGMAHCGPVAAANHLLWFAKNGFENLVKGEPTENESISALVKSLGGYMRTSRSGGTDVRAFLLGMQDYVDDRGYQCRLRYNGWEACPARFACKGSARDLLNASSKNNAAGWIKIGWYKFNPKTLSYVRFAGHWVSVVAQLPAHGNLVRLAIHDPAPRSGSKPCHEIVELVPLNAGTVVTGYDHGHFGARGMYKIQGELKVKKEADYGLVDGVVCLDLLRPI